MGYFVGLPLGGAAEKDCQVRFGKNMTFQVETRAPHLPAEWALQSGIQLTWPHAGTDWTYMLDEVQECFVAIAHEIAARETSFRVENGVVRRLPAVWRSIRSSLCWMSLSPV